MDIIKKKELANSLKKHLRDHLQMFHFSEKTVMELNSIAHAYQMTADEFAEMAIMVFINREKRGEQNEYSF